MRAICHARVATAQVARASKPSRHVQTGSGNTVPLYDFLVMTFFFVAFFFVTFDGQSVRVMPLIFFVVHPFGAVMLTVIPTETDRITLSAVNPDT